jgi:hypothetical protein
MDVGQTVTEYGVEFPRKEGTWNRFPLPRENKAILEQK